MANLYALQSFKEDTIATGDSLTTAETSTTLTLGSFSDTTLALLTFDYDVPASKEIIKCSISGSTVTVITRGMDGTSSTNHAAGAKVIMAFVPSHYSALTDFVGARGYLTSSLTTTVASVSTQILLDGESYDVGANFDKDTNHRFVAPVNGYYQINAGVFYTSVTAAAKKFGCYVYKGANVALYGVQHSSVVGNICVTSSGIIYLAATDTVSLFYFHDDATTVDVAGGETYTHLDVTLLKEV